MRSPLVSSALFLITTFFASTSALQAIENSPCASKCGNILSETNGLDDITCVDREYGTTSKGNVFQQCINCQLNSKYVDPRTKETDLQWALYNLRYAVSWCLFGYPNNTKHASTPCMTRTACGTLENAFEFDSLSPNATAYGYCTLLHEDVIPKCTACVGQSDEFYITNFITTLNAACKQQPIAGATVSIEGNLFSDVHVNVTDPNAAAKSEHRQDKGGLPLGAKVGIAAGALVVALIILGCCVVYHGKRRRRAVISRRQRESGYHEWVSQQVTQRSPAPPSGFPRSPGGYYDSPQSAVSQKPLFPDTAWSRGRVIDDTMLGGEKTFSPYTSNYSSPISATEQVQVAGRDWPVDRASQFAAGTAIGGPDRPVARSKSMEKKEIHGDRIEMQNVAPVLLHPGNGRQGLDHI